jgi:hypothetical protein
VTRKPIFSRGYPVTSEVRIPPEPGRPRLILRCDHDNHLARATLLQRLGWLELVGAALEKAWEMFNHDNSKVVSRNHRSVCGPAEL